MCQDKKDHPCSSGSDSQVPTSKVPGTCQTTRQCGGSPSERAQGSSTDVTGPFGLFQMLTSKHFINQWYTQDHFLALSMVFFALKHRVLPMSGLVGNTDNQCQLFCVVQGHQPTNHSFRIPSCRTLIAIENLCWHLRHLSYGEVRRYD